MKWSSQITKETKTLTKPFTQAQSLPSAFRVLFLIMSRQPSLAAGDSPMDVICSYTP